MPAQRKIALLALTPPQPKGEGHAGRTFPSYGIQRIAAAIRALGDPDVEVRLFDAEDYDAEAIAREVEAWSPDIVGISVFVWSLPVLLDVARRLKASEPERFVVIGGPSARVSMLAVDGYQDTADFVDAIVPGEGERVIQQLVRLPYFAPDTLATIQGVTYASEGRWIESTSRATPLDLADVPSPYEVGIGKPGAPGYLETYRGCPLHCLFCEWGFGDSATRTFPEDRVLSELRLLKELRPPSVFNVDPGLNLNARAFRALDAAEREVGLFTDAIHICEVYPSHMTPETLRFLDRSKHTYVGVGLQSFDDEVLRMHKRKQDAERLERVVREMSALGSHVGVDLQIILGLPGDTPKTFKATVERAMRLPADVRIYHLLVLPDALLDRSPPEFAMDFDPYTMRIRSCLGWSAAELQQTREWLVRLCEETGGSAGPWWWSLPGRPRDVAGEGRSGHAAAHGGP